MKSEIKQIKSIITTRFNDGWPSDYFVHEWEEIFQQRLNVPFFSYSKENMHFLASRISGLDVAILPRAQNINYYKPHINLIPIVVDCWKHDIPSFLSWYSESPLTFVSSLETYRDLKAAGFTGRLGYMPMSVADTICRTHVQEKYFDVIQYGRRNRFLDYCMERFCKRFPQVSYVTMEVRQNRICYTSSKHGHLGDFHERSRFLELLAASRVSLVSSPGMDDSKDTGGYNPVAVRFFESASQFCHMLGRYPDNEDFKQCGVGQVCDSVERYEEFEEKLIMMLSKPFDRTDEYYLFLSKNVTSVRAVQLMEDLKLLGIDRCHGAGLRANLLGMR